MDSSEHLSSFRALYPLFRGFPRASPTILFSCLPAIRLLRGVLQLILIITYGLFI